MITFAETERIRLRSLQEDELPRLTSLIGDWDVARWLSVIPFPYTLDHAKEFYNEVHPHDHTGAPHFFVIAPKSDNRLIGGVGLHLPRNATYIEGQVEIGYWLGKEYWNRGFMREAAHKAVDLCFKRLETRAIGASTSPSNKSSQNVLEKLGLKNQGLHPRDYSALRGEAEIIKWLLTREEYEARESL